MSNLILAAGTVCALSVCASGVCIVIAYHTPPALRDAAEDTLEAIQSLWRDDPPSGPPDDNNP